MLLTNFMNGTDNLNQKVICLGRMLKWNQTTIPKEDCYFWDLVGCKVDEQKKESAIYYTATLPKFKIEKKTNDK